MVALLPDLFGHQVLDPYYQHVLVVRAIEDDQLALAGHLLMHAPEIIAGQLVLGGYAKASHPHPAGVYPVEDHPDGAILAAGIHGLQDHQHLVLAFGKEQFL